MVDTTQKTVYFLGAGASAESDFHLPTMDKFFRENDFAGDDYNNLKRFIKDKFCGLSVGSLNLEELVTAIELSMDTFGSFWKHPEPYIYEARTELNKYVANRLKIDTQKRCKTLEKIITPEIANGSSADSVISLNYDLVIDILIKVIPKNSESLLSRMYGLLGIHPQGIAYVLTYDAMLPTLYSRNRKIGFYLKLHGSIDWLYCPNPACGNHQIFSANELYDDERMHSEPGDLCTLCGMPIVSVIVPPTMYKTFEKFPKLGFLWSLAYRQLNWADKIVIFGVSFAESDYYLRWLFKKAITDRENNPTIINIDTNPKVCDKIKEFTGVNPEYFPTLEKYLDRASVCGLGG
jgi:hypothetical protein